MFYSLLSIVHRIVLLAFGTSLNLIMLPIPRLRNRDEVSDVYSDEHFFLFFIDLSSLITLITIGLRSVLRF